MKFSWEISADFYEKMFLIYLSRESPNANGISLNRVKNQTVKLDFYQNQEKLRTTKSESNFFLTISEQFAMCLVLYINQMEVKIRGWRLKKTWNQWSNIVIFYVFLLDCSKRMWVSTYFTCFLKEQNNLITIRHFWEKKLNI